MSLRTIAARTVAARAVPVAVLATWLAPTAAHADAQTITVDFGT